MFGRYAPGMRLLPLIVVFACLQAPLTAHAEAGRAAVVVKHDGTRQSGELIEQTERGFLLKGEGGLFLVPFDEVDHVEYGDQAAEDEDEDKDEANAPVDDEDEPPVDAESAEPSGAPSWAGAGASTPTAYGEASTPTANGEASPPTQDDDGAVGAWVVIKRSDGSTVSGTLLEEAADALVVQAGAEALRVPYDQVERVVRASLDEPAPQTAAPAPAPATSGVPTPATSGVPSPSAQHRSVPSAREADPLLQARLRPEFLQYQRERLQLVDRGATWLGPRKLGYAREVLDADKELPFHAVIVGEPDYRLTIPEFLDLTGDEPLRGRYDRAISLATARNQVGIAMMIVGAGLSAAAAGSMAVSAAGVDFGEGLGIAAPLLLIGLPHLAGGGTMIATAAADKRRLAGTELDAAFDRTGAFAGVQKYNGHLRDRYGLPDSWTLDAPSE